MNESGGSGEGSGNVGGVSHAAEITNMAATGNGKLEIYCENEMVESNIEPIFLADGLVVQLQENGLLWCMFAESPMKRNSNYSVTCDGLFTRIN